MPAVIPIENTQHGYAFNNLNVTENGVNTISFLETSKEWLQAILNDDIESVENIINNCSQGDRNRLINGMFRFQEDIQSYLTQGIDLKPYALCPVTRPWCIAAVAGAHKVMDALLRYGVDVRQYDENRNNVVHALVYVAFLNPKLEKQLTFTYKYIRKVLPVGKCRDLLISENSIGFRPLELAAQVGTFSLFTALFNTEGVYLNKQQSHGVYTIQWFDITEYEMHGPENRRNRSPLLSLMLLHPNKLSDPSTDALFRSDVIQSWVSTKIKSNSSFVWVWFIVRMFFLMVFIIYDLSGSWVTARSPVRPILNATGAGNGTTYRQPCVGELLEIPTWLHDILGGYLLIQSSISVIYYVVWISNYLSKRFRSNMYQLPTGHKKLLVSRDFYIFCQFLLCTGILFGMTYVTVRKHLDVTLPQTMVSYIYFETWIGLIWSVLFFAQMLPWIGHFVIAVQRMVTDLLKFTLVYSVFLAAFSIAFARMTYPGKDYACPKSFESFDRSIYSTIITMLNMVQYQRFNVDDSLGLSTLHVVYVFMVAVMLLNFLIALFSNSVTYVYDNRRVIETVQKLSVIFMLEDTLVWVAPCLRKYVLRKYFSRSDERIYLNRVVVHTSTSQ